MIGTMDVESTGASYKDQKVVIYHEAGALPAGALEDVLTQAKELDMAKVHEELEKRDREA